MTEPRQDVDAELEQRYARHSTWPAAACGELLGALQRLADAGLATEHDRDELALLQVTFEDRKSTRDRSPILG